MLGVVFGAASTYLALRVGLTTSASVPIAVLAIWAIRRKRGQRAILEHNIVQTTGSAGESVAAAVVFTRAGADLPRLSAAGRADDADRAHGRHARRPDDGAAAALPDRQGARRAALSRRARPARRSSQAGEKGGTSATKVFVGLGDRRGVQGVPGDPRRREGARSRDRARRASRARRSRCDVAPELLGVGYIIGYRTSLMMVAGSLLASFILVPMIVLFGSGLTQPLAPATTLDPRHGAGRRLERTTSSTSAPARSRPAGSSRSPARCRRSSRRSARRRASLIGGGAAGGAGRCARTATRRCRCSSSARSRSSRSSGLVPAFQMNAARRGADPRARVPVLASCRSRITGEVGSSSCPLSGMTIGVLMATCGVFLLVGWEGSAYSRLALMIGAIVCIAISNAGHVLAGPEDRASCVGATPVKQQGALLDRRADVGARRRLDGVPAQPRRDDRDSRSRSRSRSRAALVAQARDVESQERRRRPTRSCASRTQDAARGRSPTASTSSTARRGEARFRREDGIGAGTLQAPQAKLMSVVIDGLLTHKLPWDLILIGVAIALFIELLGVPLAHVRGRRVPAALVDDAGLPRRARAQARGQAATGASPTPRTSRRACSAARA